MRDYSATTKLHTSKSEGKTWQYCGVAKKRDLAIIIIIIIIIIKPSNLHHSFMSAESYLSLLQDVNVIRRFESVHE